MEVIIAFVSVGGRCQPTFLMQAVPLVAVSVSPQFWVF